MTALERICAALGASGVRYAVVGGHAVALHGAVRGTVDIDIVIAWSRKALASVESALGKIGLESRLPVTAGEIFDFRDEYIANKNLVAWNFYNPLDLSEQVDVLINYDLKGKKIKRIELRNSTIRILSLKDLIEMKRLSGRPQDVEDVRALEKLV